MSARRYWFAALGAVVALGAAHCGQAFSAAGVDGGVEDEGAPDVDVDALVHFAEVTTLASGESTPMAIAVDNQRIFWVNAPANASQSVRSMYKDGAGQAATLASGQAGLLDIAVDGTAVYWSVNTNTPPPTTAQCMVMVFTKVVDIKKCIVTGQASPLRLALDEENVIVLSSNGQQNPTIAYATKAGGGYTSTQVGGPSAATAGTSTEIFVGNAHGPHVDSFPIAPQGQFQQNGNVCTTACAGIPTATIVDMVLDDTGETLFWAASDGSVESGPANGSAATGKLLATVAGAPQRIAVDANYVYVTSSAGDVFAVPVGGGQPVTLASGQSQPFGIATDGTNVYWTCSGDGSIRATSVAQ